LNIYKKNGYKILKLKFTYFILIPILFHAKQENPIKFDAYRDKNCFLIATFPPFSKLFIESGSSGANNTTQTQLKNP